MSKAEDRAAKKALETFPILFGERMGYDKTNLQQERRNAYEKGYHQAEKDNELTWEDMQLICKIEFSICYYEYKDKKLPPKEQIYKEILKRFKERKENCIR